jgi:DMSO/TMAO reductase YedYZ molybdopterin-dependent catalytic subunit
MEAGETVDGRRTFVRATGIVAGLGAVAFYAGRGFGSRRSSVEQSREAVALPEEAVGQPRGADLEIKGSEPWQTPNEVFYRIDTALSVPLVRAETWRLRVHGLVGQEVNLTFDELVDLGLVESWVTLTCVSNEVGGYLAGNALWTGVPVADVLAMAVPDPDADAVRSTSADGWTAGTPLDVLTDGRDALFAVAMNGEPLPVEHGFPVRMVVPGLYGYVSATKWVVDLEVTRFEDFDAYWTTRGWAEQAPIKTVGGYGPGRPRRGRWRGLGAASRDPDGRGTGRRRAVAACAAGRRADQRHLAAVGVGMGRHSGRP